MTVCGSVEHNYTPVNFSIRVLSSSAISTAVPPFQWNASWLLQTDQLLARDAAAAETLLPAKDLLQGWKIIDGLFPHLHTVVGGVRAAINVKHITLH